MNVPMRNRSSSPILTSLLFKREILHPPKIPTVFPKMDGIFHYFNESFVIDPLNDFERHFACAARRTAGGRDKVRPQAGRTCEQSMLSSYPASIVCLRAKHGSRPKYAFGERIHARRTCLMPPFLLAERGGRMGMGGGLKKKTRTTTKARCTHLWRHSELLS